MARRPGAITHAFGSDPIIVAYGVSVDSTAMLIGLRDRHVQPALILIWGPERRDWLIAFGRSAR